MRVKRNICLSFIKLASHPSSAHVSVGFAFFFQFIRHFLRPFLRIPLHFSCGWRGVDGVFQLLQLSEVVNAFTQTALVEEKVDGTAGQSQSQSTHPAPHH